MYYITTLQMSGLILSIFFLTYLFLLCQNGQKYKDFDCLLGTAPVFTCSLKQSSPWWTGRLPLALVKESEVVAALEAEVVAVLQMQ